MTTNFLRPRTRALALNTPWMLPLLGAGIWALAQSTALAQTITNWTGGNAVWTDSTHWTNGVPQAGYNANLETNSSTAVYFGGPAGNLNKVTVSSSNASDPATLLLAGGTLSVLREIIGNDNTGTFNQTAGINVLPTSAVVDDGQLVLGKTTGGFGTYNLSGGILSADAVTVGGGSTAGGTSGRGLFLQSGGSVNLTLVGTIGELLVSDAAGSIGTYQLSGGTLKVNDLYVAVSGTSTGERSFLQSGGATTVLGSVQIGGFDGGSTATAGSYTLSGTSSSTLNATNVYVGVSGIGTFNQEGGVHSIDGGVAGEDRSLLVAAFSPGSVGTYNLRSGTLSAEGEFIGNPGRGEFVQSGGTNLVNGQLLIDTNGTADSSGTYTITGGNLTTTGSADQPGVLNLNQLNLNGGIVTVNGVGTNAGLDNTGTVSMANGTLTGNATKINSGTWTGYGTISGTGAFVNRGTTTFTGGTTTVQSDVSNEPTHLLQISNSVAVFNGNVTNDGTIKTTAANVIFNGDFGGSGTFISDPSTQTFNNNFSVSGQGALVGGTGDVWRFGLGVNITSTNGSGWTTELSQMDFFKGTTNSASTHNLTYPGLDLGPTSLGYVDNFAWGIVNVATGNQLTNTSDTALYTKALILSDGVAQVSTFTGNLSIYYDPADPANSYLGGQTYNFGAGDGFVAPIPEPSAVWLLVMGSVAFGFRRRVRP